MKKDTLIIKLILAVILGGVIGLVANETFISIIMMFKYVLGEIIFFTIPLIIIGFIASSIATLKNGASKLLSVAVGLAYFSTLGAALMSMIAGYAIIPNLNIVPTVEGLKELPELIFELEIEPIMPVMSALVLSVLLGLAVSWTKSELFEKLLFDFQEIILQIVMKVVMPILPIFIGTTFAVLAYEGSLTKHLPVFISVILIVIVGHFIWLSVLYIGAGVYAKVSPKEVFRHYPQAYLTAVGTMSSAATLPMSLKCANKSKVLRKDIVSFGIPLFANIHLCGSVLTEVFFVMTVSQILYNQIPSITEMLVFVVLLGIFGIGAPGVPGGTVMASLGLITGVLGFDADGTALMLTVFALQDSFGTACNVTGDGALTLMLSRFADKNLEETASEVAR